MIAAYINPEAGETALKLMKRYENSQNVRGSHHGKAQLWPSLTIHSATSTRRPRGAAAARAVAHRAEGHCQRKCTAG